MRNLIYLLSFLLIGGLANTIQAQDEEPILLNNPSFEDFPSNSQPPEGWIDCGFTNETPPDIQPHTAFKVTKPAYDGNTYLGMVVRDNETWESVCQRLSRPMEGGKCYEFEIMLARSESYWSQTRSSVVEKNYTTPAKLRIWGGNGPCNKAYLLDQSKVVVNHRWLVYKFQFEPIEDYSYLTLEAFYNTPIIIMYNGNLLLDKASAITPVPCDEEEQTAPSEPSRPIAAAKPPKPQNKRPTPPKSTSPSTSSTKAEVTLNGVKRSELRAGQTVRIDRITFQADSSRVMDSSIPILDGVYDFLKANPDLKVEVGGHTNMLPSPGFANTLSEKRAKAVMDYLISKGIPRYRLSHKGYGKTKPLSRAFTTAAHKKNQRVEIKIISMNANN